MFDTNVTIVGNVLTAPEWRRTANTNSLVANFKVASTARRLDRDSGRWIDGNSLRVRVNCWRKLAEGVASSVMVGDPIVVVGRLYTRDWTDAEGNTRTLYELEAAAVGHDLARGRGRFTRNRPTLATSVVEDAEADAQVRGEASEPVPRQQIPAGPGDGLFDGADPDFADVPAVLASAEPRPAAGQAYHGGPAAADDLSPDDPSDDPGRFGEGPFDDAQGQGDADDDIDLVAVDGEDPAAADPVNADPVNADPVNADPVNADPVNADPVDVDPSGSTGGRRGRRPRGRVPQPV